MLLPRLLLSHRQCVCKRNVVQSLSPLQVYSQYPTAARQHSSGDSLQSTGDMSQLPRRACAFMAVCCQIVKPVRVMCAVCCLCC